MSALVPETIVPTEALLLDTHVWIWLSEGNPRLSVQARHSIQSAADQNCLFVSAITPWEMALLVSKGRLTLQTDVQQWIDQALALPGIRLYPLLPQIAVASTRLPWDMHGDPADRILVATARHSGATLITADQQLLHDSAGNHFRGQSAI